MAYRYKKILKHQYAQKSYGFLARRKSEIFERSTHSVNGGWRDPPLFTRGILTVLKNHKAISHATNVERPKGAITGGS